ncbi:Suppressor of the cold-sensitive snRNP biogenesis mutant brr1-1 [Podila minutissima]|nr:Suppressor of the cold-sensitive snRNP biogenesis mutant brr1-1 [Podila minutissima]
MNDCDDLIDYDEDMDLNLEPSSVTHMNDYDDLVSYEDEMDLNLGPSSTTDMNEDKRMDPAVGASTVTFRDMILKPELFRAIVDCGFEQPSEVQRQCIPLSILGLDTLCQAKSGTGKTAVFVISTLQQLYPIDGQVSAIVLCNTRELAFQIKGEFTRFCKYMPEIRSEVFYGGQPIAADQAVLANKSRSPQVVVPLAESWPLSRVATSSSNTSGTSFWTNMHYDVQQIFKACPREKQVLMFSATINELLRTRCRRFMFQPQEVCVDKDSKLTLDGLQQHYINLTESKKNRKLKELLDNLKFNQVFIFVKSVERAIQLDQLLKDHNFPSIAIHSRTTQETRMTHFNDFKDLQKRIAVSTDVFSRGMDVSRVNVVINYDFPLDADTYLHRVGRAGRFGTKGRAISFVSSDDDKSVLQSVQDRFEVNIPEMPDVLNGADCMDA